MSGVDVVYTTIEPPYCIHGPTLLFERFYARKQPKKFFACAVHRTRKCCKFFHWEDEPLTNQKRQRYKAAFHEHQTKLNLQYFADQIKELPGLKRDKLWLCEDCGMLIMTATEDHSKHRIRQELNDVELRFPSRLLCPMDDDKGQAQYFFSDKTQAFLISEITRLKKTHIVCLGVPRLHEDLIDVGHVKSFLLDIDYRYAQFYSSNDFQRYNMFNGFFYSGEEGKEKLNNFLISVIPENILLVIDPPFGGLMKALRTGVNTVWDIVGQEVSTMLVFPYFNESHVSEAFPSFVMMDYQITYAEHKHFGEKGKRGKPSPVRIYTNISPPALHLPEEEGYWFCSDCNRYVHKNNIHCRKCNFCTSKDGRLYRHCDLCGLCVKQRRRHCDICQSCQLPDHSCQSKSISGCHICGGLDHKRRHCPSRQRKQTKRKRHQINTDSGRIKKRKTQ